jgi:hypothetical protein
MAAVILAIPRCIDNRVWWQLMDRSKAQALPTAATTSQCKDGVLVPWATYQVVPMLFWSGTLISSSKTTATPIIHNYIDWLLEIQGQILPLNIRKANTVAYCLSCYCLCLLVSKPNLLPENNFASKKMLPTLYNNILRGCDCDSWRSK